jgi:hypothetical protein
VPYLLILGASWVIESDRLIKYGRRSSKEAGRFVLDGISASWNCHWYKMLDNGIEWERWGVGVKLQCFIPKQ